MKRSSDSLETENDGKVPPEKKIYAQTTVIAEPLETTGTICETNVDNPVLGMDAIMPQENIASSDVMQFQFASTASIIMNEQHSDGFLGDGANFGIICQHMDITEPLTTLRYLLEQRINTSLEGYQFYLQDTQELDANKNLVNQCVQGEGLVQINVEITHKDIKKINIIDVLKPAEEIVVTPDTGQQSDKAGETPLVKKVLIPVTEETKQITRWIVSPEFRQEQDRLKIPLDPLHWTQDHICHWIKWAIQQFNLHEVSVENWNITGKELCELSHVDFVKKVPYDPGNFFWTHLELLRNCKIVAVIQQPSYVQPLSQGFTTIKNNVKSRLKSKIGAPRVAFEGCPGNRTGNNGQIQLWQFLLELLTDKDQREYIQWVGNDGEFKLNNPEMVAHLWGQRKNKPTMNYEKLSRALRYYYDGDMIAKVHGKRFVYKFVCDLKSLLGYDTAELNRLVMESEQKKLEKLQNTTVPFSTVEVTSLGASSQSTDS